MAGSAGASRTPWTAVSAAWTPRQNHGGKRGRFPYAMDGELALSAALRYSGNAEATLFGSRIDMVLSGLRPILIIQNFKRKLIWKPSPDLPPIVADGLRAYQADGFFASLSENLAVNFFEIFLVAYGAGNREIGAMAAVANLLGFVSLFPGVEAVRLLGRRKPVVLIGGGFLGRLMYLALALVPWVLPDPRAAIPAIIAFNGIRVFMSNFSNPAWTGMTADLVPENIRGSFFASRNAIIAVVGSAATLTSGWIVERGNALSGRPNLGFSLVFSAAFIFGLCSTGFFAKVPDLGGGIRRRRLSLMALARGVIRYPLFVAFLAFTFVWNFSLFVSAPFFNVYMLKDLHASPVIIGLSSTMGNLISAVALPFWGRFVDRRGNFRVMGVAGFLIPLLPIAWLFTTRSWHPLIINCLGGFLWAGFNLANFNVLLKMIPEEYRQEGAALYQALVLGSTVLGPIVGAEIVEAAGYKASFLASGLFRYVALIILAWKVLTKVQEKMVTRPTKN